MKKVKVILTTVTIVAAVGGALAFKAVKFGTNVYCSTTQGTTSCPIQRDKTYTAKSNTGLFCTTSSTAACNTEAILSDETR
jgi:hypothetical protein